MRCRIPEDLLEQDPIWGYIGQDAMEAAKMSYIAIPLWWSVLTLNKYSAIIFAGGQKVISSSDTVLIEGFQVTGGPECGIRQTYGSLEILNTK